MKQELESYIEMTKVEQPIELLMDLILSSLPKVLLLKAKLKLRIYLFSLAKVNIKKPYITTLHHCK